MSARRPLVLIILLVTACRTSAPYSGVGEVVEIDASRQHLTIRHEGIRGLMDPATVRVAVRSPELLAAIASGTRVRFDVQQERDGLVVTRIAPVAAGQPGLHDHTPHHGGVVAMVGMIHLEALATPEGRVRVYLSDVWRRPLPLANVSGSVTLQLAGKSVTLPFVGSGEALEASGQPLEGSEVYARVELTRDSDPVEMSFVLPLVHGAPGAAGVPVNGCSAPPEATGSKRAPRCTLAFSRPITSLAATPDGMTVLIAAVDLGVSGWRMPAGELSVGFTRPPPIVVPQAESPHPEVAQAVVVDPRGSEAMVALENRLLRYRISNGELVSAITASGMVRALALAPDGGSMLVATFYDSAVRLLSVGDGRETGRWPMEHEGSAVAFAPDGQVAAVGSDVGPIMLFDVPTGSRRHLLTGGTGAVQALAFVDRRLVSAGDDGVLRVWDVASGSLLAQSPPGRQLTRLAVTPGGHLVAAAGLDGSVQLYDVTSATRLDSLEWHRAQVLGLAWAGAFLVSGDLDGRVAVWDLAARLGDAGRQN